MKYDGVIIMMAVANLAMFAAGACLIFGLYLRARLVLGDLAPAGEKGIDAAPVRNKRLRECKAIVD